MLIFIYGSDSYRVKEYSDQITAAYLAKHKSGVNLLSLDLGEYEAMAKADDTMRSRSFFNEIRLVKITGAFNDKKTADDFLAVLEKNKMEELVEVACLLTVPFSGKELSAKNIRLFKFLSSHSKPLKCLELTKNRNPETIKWAGERFKEAGIKISPSVLRYLVEVAGDDAWRLAGEIKKLAHYKGVGSEIGTSDVDAVVPKAPESNIFKITDALAARDKGRAVESLYRELSNGRDAYEILGLMVAQFRAIAMMRDMLSRAVPMVKAVEQSGLHPFVARKAYFTAGKFSAEELRSAYSRLANLDIKSKSGLLNLEDELYRFALS